MFHIGVVELALTCGLMLLVLVIPWMFTRFYARLNKRLQNIEKNINKKNSDTLQ